MSICEFIMLFWQFKRFKCTDGLTLTYLNRKYRPIDYAALSIRTPANEFV